MTSQHKRAGSCRTKVSEWEKVQEKLRANLQQLLISSSAVNYEKQNRNKSKVFFKITH